MRRLLSVLALFVSVASALPALAAAEPPLAHLPIASFGSFQNPQNIAVDQSNGDVYVLDVGAKTISRFDSNLAAKKFSALNTNVIDGAATTLCTGVASPNCDQTPFNGFSFSTPAAAQVAIDNSGSPLTNGDIYVADSTHHVVAIFAPTGAYLGQLTSSGSGGAVFGETCGVAVDPSGAVYIGDATKGKVHKFVPTTGPPTNADFSADFTSPQPCELAAGAGPTAGSLFVSKKNGVVTKLNGAGALQYQLSSAVGRGVAVDPSTGHVFLATGAEVAEYDASGAVAPASIGAFGPSQLTTVGGVAADGPRSRVYVSDSSTGKVYVYGPLAPPVKPVVTPGLATPLPSRARVSGYVDGGGAAATYYFEYGPADCAVGACVSVPATQDAAVAKGIGPVAVSQVLSGLQASTTYHYRLVATNAAGTTFGPDGTLTTPKAAPGSACANESLRVAQQAGYLPDCRAYELVSSFAPAERNGADVLVNTERIRAATGGGAFQFSSFAGAGDIGGLPFTAEYMSVRNPVSGWAVHGITPPEPPTPAGSVLNERESHYEGEFAPDLSKAVFRSTSALNGEGPNVQEITNLYLREDLLSPGPGAYRLRSDASSLQSPHPVGQTTGPDTELPDIAGVSADLSHVVFESTRNLTASAATLAQGPRLYEWADGEVRLVGVLPLAEGGGPTISKIGQGAKNYSPHAVSTNGSRVMFMVPLSGNTATNGRLYLRDDRETATTSDDTTVKINASEKTNGGGPGGGDPLGAQPATFWNASADLSQVFFTSTEALTEDAPTDEPGVSKLYRYELSAPSGHHLTLLSVDHNPADGIADAAEGVAGVSDDGSYVYFVGPNQLVAGRPTGSTPRIFVWHEGAIHQVAAINSGTELQRILGSTGWKNGGKWSRVSPDGKHLLFVTEGTSELTGYEHGSTCPTGTSTQCKEVYVYSAADAEGDERLQCASCNPNGQKATRDADFNIHDEGSLILSFAAGDAYLNRALSPDGKFVFFTSEERLSPYDENESADVYEFDTTTGLTQMLSGGRPDVAAFFLDASSDGDDVFFATRGQLLGRDGDQNMDVYDARVGGGFSEPPPAAPPCDSGDECRPATSTPPADLDPATAAAWATADRQPPRGHRAKKHRRHRRHSKAGKRHG